MEVRRAGVLGHQTLSQTRSSLAEEILSGKAEHQAFSSTKKVQFSSLTITIMDTEMADITAGSSRDGQVQVHFITNSPDIELPEEKRQLLVPTSKCRTGYVHSR